MENATDALVMAGSVLLFIIGLTVAVLSFSNVREAIDARLNYADREYITIKEDPRYYYVASTNNPTRNVGLDTVIPSLYRAFKESYTVVFNFQNFNNGRYYLYEYTDGKQYSLIDFSDNNSINIDDDDKGNHKITIAPEDVNEFINGIIYGVSTSNLENFKDKFNVTPNTQPLIEILSGENIEIEEKLGVYNSHDIGSETSILNEDTRKAQETKIRVITYIVKKKT
ncbi:MAG: hypothetical protein HUJ68_00935 [Clostridia bacterium]|nr:hypothetical protein [Clostridia bacterium]